MSREEVRTDRPVPRAVQLRRYRPGYHLSESEWNRTRNAGLGRFGLTAIDLDGTVDDSSILWRLERKVPYVPAPVLYKGLIYMVKSGGIVSAVAPSSGTLTKQVRLHEAPGDYFSSPVAGDDKVYTASEDGKIAVLQAGADLGVLAINDIGGADLRHPCPG